MTTNKKPAPKKMKKAKKGGVTVKMKQKKDGSVHVEAKSTDGTDLRDIFR